jgi:hypothetical protein
VRKSGRKEDRVAGSVEVQRRWISTEKQIKLYGLWNVKSRVSAFTYRISVHTQTAMSPCDRRTAGWTATLLQAVL